MPDQHPAHTPPGPSGSPAAPPRRPADEDAHGSDDRQLRIAEMMAGTAMMFIGFLNVLLSISGGFEINVVPMLLYFAGMAIWAHARVVNPTIRYGVMVFAVTMGLAFYHYGEVLFWHKQVIFWATIALVMFFMFKTSAPDRSDRM